jgi:hypothetical protein
MLSWHVTWASESRHPLAPDEACRRSIVRTIARVAGEAVSMFCVVDDHVHVVLFCTVAERGRYVQALSLAFKSQVVVPLGPAFVRPVRDRGHMEWLAHEYILRQPVKHGLSTPPALWSGSCFADLAGARLLPGLRLRIHDALPRWRLRTAYRAVGLPETQLVPAPDVLVRQLGASRIVAAAASAVGADPGLHGQGASAPDARRVVAALASSVGIRAPEIGWALGLTRQAVNRLIGRETSAALTQATRLQLALEEAVAALPPVAREPEPPPYEEGWRSP